LRTVTTAWLLTPETTPGPCPFPPKPPTAPAIKPCAGTRLTSAAAMSKPSARERTRDAKRLVYVQNVGNSTVNAYHAAGEPADDILAHRRRHSSTFEGVSMPSCLEIQEASNCSNRLEEQSSFLSPNRPKRCNIWRLSGSIDPLQLPDLWLW
jgi:hypothetical protein